MSTINITLDFKNRFLGNVSDIASYSGIYVVFSYRKVETTEQWDLLDIGQADNIYERHLKHERKKQWEDFAKKNHSSIYIYTAEITNEHNYRNIAEAALLYRFQPQIAQEGKEGYHHGDVTIQVTGRLKNYFGTFTVTNTDSK